MALFLIVALKSTEPAVAQAVANHFAGNFYQIEDDKWFVNSALVTAKAVSDLLGITSDPPVEGTMQGVVVKVSGYWGKGPSDMWEWVSSKPSVS